MSKKTLRQLYAEHTGKVSDKWSLYLNEYDRLFDEYRDKPTRLLEIGIQNGGSLEIWSKYFSNPLALVGCDINQDCSRLSYDDPRISVVVGDANAPEVKSQVLLHSPQFEIIIDDGSHLSSDIVKSFALYFPYLAEGGVFIAEDLHCSYWGSFEGGLFDPHSSISFFKRLADVINHEHWGIPKARTDILHGIFTKYGCEIDTETLSQVHSVEFINSMCVVRKASIADNCLGQRIIAGSMELVVSGHQELHGVPYQLDPIFDQSGNPWTARTKPPDEAIEQAELKLAEAQQQNSMLEQQVLELNLRISCLHSSSSWRITAPFRFAVTGTRRLANKLRQDSSNNVLVPTSPITPVAYDNLRDLLVQRGHAFYRRHMKGTQLGRLIGQQVLKRGLVTSLELQISALSHDSLAIQEKPCVDSTQVEADSGVPGFHLSPPLNFEISEALAVRPRINVLLPSLRLKHMSGGPNTALLLAALLVEKGEWVRLIACDATAEGEEAALFPHMDGLLQRPVARERIELVDAFDRTCTTEIGINDLFFATAWWTAQIAKYALRKTVHKTFIYLIQDFEPILHEGSTFQARALETYGLPHIPVVNSHLLLDHLAREKAGCYADPQFATNALWFEPALDRNYYFPDTGKKKKTGKKVLLFYARPTVARRNLFEIGVVALRQVVASGVIDKDNWEVWAMGEKLAPVALGNGVFLNPLPWMSFDAYAERVRTADLLLSLMLSPHPSYPPLEMAASGKMVVTNSFSVKTAERMQAFSPNIIVADPTAESIATALNNAASRINIGLSSYDPSGSVTLPSDWDESLGEIVPTLLQRIQALREIPPNSDMPLAVGFPITPKTEYENYRRSRLTYRRRDGDYQQEPALLSFITSAYNTAPVFLEELGGSMFQQDGGTQFEWLILDNGSTNEDTCRALQELARHPCVRLERVEKNLGIIGGMRFCLEHAHGRYILPLDSDDLIEPDCVHVVTRHIKNNDYPVLLYTDEDKLSAGRFGSPYFKPDWDPVLFIHSCYIAHLCVIDREHALQLGLYSDKTAEGCHDWDSFIRFMNAGHVPYHIPEILYSWRIHSESTSGNISSKSYITESHRNTLQRFLNHSGVPNIELVNSPLFSYNVDWWFRRKRVAPQSMQTIVITPAIGMMELFTLIQNIDSELIHLCWQDVVPDDDEWRWDAMALLELFPDTVMVGGILHNGNKIIDGPSVFGFGDGFDCPDNGRLLSDPGYGARMWKPHTVSAAPIAHCVIKRDFFIRCMSELLKETVSTEMLGFWLGAQALQMRNRVVYSPFMRARLSANHKYTHSLDTKEHFLSRFWSMIPDQRIYSSMLGLERTKAYVAVDPIENQIHHLRLQAQLLPYPKWLEMRLRRRTALYPIHENSVSITLITTVYENTDMGFLDILAATVMGQTLKAAEWVIVAHGPIIAKNIEHIIHNSAEHWGATVIVEPQPLGIMGAMRLGLERASGDYIVPVDADDMLTADAIQILTCSIVRLNNPDLIYSDEDMLIGEQPSSPYLRSVFDPILNLDSSYIWHLCAIKRKQAIALKLYTDSAATWCHDWDTIMRITNARGCVEHIPEVLYHWRQHTGSTTNNQQGDPRSLQSIRHVLEQQILRTATPEHFYIAEWPENRGARELYIARCADNLPQFVWVGDSVGKDIKYDENAILVVADNGVLIESQQVFVEVARLFDLHPSIGAVGGLVKGKDDVIVDGCYMINHTGKLESPWRGQPMGYNGAYSLALKTQTVTTTGKSLAFFRISALQKIGAWSLQTYSSNEIIHLCGKLASQNWYTAFSPLVRAHSATFCQESGHKLPPCGISAVSPALIRYGACCDHKTRV